MGVRSRLIDWFFKDTASDLALKQGPPEVGITGTVLGGTTGSSSYNAKTIKNYAQFGYLNNIIVYRAINIVAQACASVDWRVYKTGSNAQKRQRVIIENHPLHYLLANPNPHKARSSFIEQLISYWMIAGENFLFASFNAAESVQRRGVYPVGLYNLRPDLVTQHGGANGEIDYFRYDVGTSHIDYPAWKILPLRFFHPLDELSGLSVIQVAAAVVERQNAGEEWNFHLMKNMARPSGAFVAATEFSDDARIRLKREILNKYGRGKQTAGMPMLLENGLSYVPLAISPVDADWFNSDSSAGRKIASAIGVDPLLLSDKQYSTYNNELEAKLAMWELTCFPLMEKLKDELNGFLLPFYEPGIEIDYDREPIESLKRNRQLESVTTIAEWNTGLRSFNDSSIDLALETVADGDDFYRFGPTTFVRKADIGAFLDAQKKIWSAPPPILGAKPGFGGGSASAGGQGIPNPSQGNTLNNPVQRNPVPVIHEPANLRSEKDEYTSVYNHVEKERAQWYAHLKQGVATYFTSELLVLLQAIGSQTTLPSAKTSALTTLHLHGEQLQKLLAEYYASIAQESARAIGYQFGTKCSIFNKEGITSLGLYAGTTITGILATSEKQITEVFATGETEQLPVSEVVQRLRTLYQGWKDARAESIAKNEVITAYNVGSYLAASQTGLPLFKTWVTAHDSMRHQHVQGQRQYFEAPFDVNGSPMLFPKDGTMGAAVDDLIGCRCTLMYSQDWHPEENPYHQNYVANLVAGDLLHV